MKVTLLLASLSCISSRVIQRPVEGTKLCHLRGGAVKPSVPGGSFKLVKSWDGDAKDLGLGVLVGAGTGYFLGQGVKATSNLVRAHL